MPELEQPSGDGIGKRPCFFCRDRSNAAGQTQAKQQKRDKEEQAEGRRPGHRTSGRATGGRKEYDEAEETKTTSWEERRGRTPQRVRRHEAGTSEEKRVGGKKKQRRNAETGQLVVRDHSSLDLVAV